MDVSIVIPCLDEAETIAACVQDAIGALATASVNGEVLVVDNGSSDESRTIAQQGGARVILEHRRGYGRALRRGCDEAYGDMIVMGDADRSYDLSRIDPFVDGLRSGAGLVMGTRLRGTILPGAMPWLNRYVGNPFLTGLLNRLFGTRVSDVHCGMRACTKVAYERMQLRATGMEFASEMLIKAAVEDIPIAEVPITFHPDGRSRPPHLRPWRDGWRHLKLILLFSPSALFLVPGIILAVLGVGLMAVQLTAPVEEPLRIGNVRMDFHWAILGSLLLLVGFQVVLVHLFARVYAITHGRRRSDPALERAFTVVTLERVIVVSLLAIVAGLAMDARVFATWLHEDLGRLVSGETRLFIAGSTLIALGVQMFFSAFFFSILGDDYRDDG
jgi:hypothetical protein